MKSINIDFDYKDYRQYVCVLLTFAFLLISIFCFQFAWIRIAEAVRDLGLSIAYYFCNIFDIPNEIAPTVVLKSSIDFGTVIPESWQALKAGAVDFGNLFVDEKNFSEYSSAVGVKSISAITIITMILPFIILFFVMLKYNFYKQNNKYNRDSVPLRVFKRVSRYTYTPVRNVVLDVKEYISQHCGYVKFLLVLSVFSLNLFSIVIEVFAYYFYIVVDFDFTNFYLQFYKLLVDLSALLNVPWYVWICVVIMIIRKHRLTVGYRRLRHNEAKNCGFIGTLNLCYLFFASMGGGKTRTLVDTAASFENIFLSKADEQMKEINLLFPNFPWINFEKYLQNCFQNKRIYNLESAKRHVEYCGCCFNATLANNRIRNNSILHKVSPQFLQVIDCFGYDYKRYGLTHDNGLQIEHLFDVLVDYAKLYFIFTVQSSLVYSNLSILETNEMHNCGNFPMWDIDVFERPSVDEHRQNRYCHIIDYDMLRLGKKMQEDNKNANVFEFGVLPLMEIDKERGNMLDTQEIKKNVDVCNQKNDMFNGKIKMARHFAYIRGFSYVRFGCDSQRPESLNSDMRELCTAIGLEGSDDIRLLLPWFNFSELVHAILYPKFQSVYNKYRYNRGDNTLLMHLLKNTISWEETRYNRYYNTFGCIVEHLSVQPGTFDKTPVMHDYYIQPKKTYGCKFSSDALSGYFSAMTEGMKSGINDIPTYKKRTAILPELQKQHSHFINDITKYK